MPRRVLEPPFYRKDGYQHAENYSEAIRWVIARLRDFGLNGATVEELVARGMKLDGARAVGFLDGLYKKRLIEKDTYLDRYFLKVER